MEGEVLSRMFAALSAANEAILRARSESELYQRVCDGAVLGGKSLGAAVIVARDDGLLHWIAVAGADFLSYFPHLVDPSLEGQGLSATALRLGRTVVTGDYANDRRASRLRDPARKLGIGSAAAIPIRRAGQVFGVFLFSLREVHSLSREMIGVLERIAENVSFALDNFDRERSRERAEQARAQVNRLYAALTAANDAILRAEAPEKMLQGVCTSIVEHGAVGSAIFLHEPSSSAFTLAASAGADEFQKIIAKFRISLDPKSPDGSGLGATAFRTGKPCVSNDLAGEPRARPWLAQIEKSGTTACAAFPLFCNGEPIGVLYIFFGGEVGRLDDSLVKLASRIAEYVSFALDRFRAEKEVWRARSFLDAVIENIPMPIVVKAPEQPDAPLRTWAYTLLNRAAERFFEVRREQWIGQTPGSVHHSAVARHFEELDRQVIASEAAATSDDDPIIMPSGLARTVRSHRVAIRDDLGRAEYVVTLLEDVTEQRQVSERIAYIAHHDSLTGLPNRAAFDEFFPKMLQATTELGGELAVMCMDLDGFKDINDQYGHATGDEVLRAMSLRLQAVAEGAFLARIGGDEFVLVKENCGGAKAAGELAARLIEASRDAFDVEGKRLSVGLSIGVALSPTHGSDCKTLLVNADLALYQAKNQQRGTIRYFSPALDSQVRAERALREDLRRALDRSELHAFYQPQVDMEREIIGFEALLRWRSPVRGDVSPMTFIPVAEQTGLVIPIGEWILREACREAALWPGSTRVAVNISPEQFKSTDLPKLVQLVLTDTGLPASRLELEITESVFIDDFARALSVLMRLKAIGIDIALDDFGTGYSSLSYLQAFPFDRIKIDRSFVSELGMNVRSDAIMRAIISMGKSLDISILAEGVETERQFEMLSEFGCNAVQGYLFGRPQPPQEIWRDARGVSVRKALA
jgi:diguanylate cyclase (GGDEF)-like protein